MKNAILKFIKIFVYGCVFGFGSPVPGVSAGTMAILLNVYDEYFKKVGFAFIKNNLLGTVVFLAGWGLGLLGISNLFMFMLGRHGDVLNFIFIGLILGCLPMIIKRTEILNKTDIKNIKWYHILACILAFSFMVFLFLFGGDLAANRTLYERGGLTPGYALWFFGASIISSLAMLVPGVGGSLILLILGVYAVYMEAISGLNVIVLLIMLAGMGFGITASFFVTRKLLEKYPQTLYFAILGFVTGSLLILFPGFAFNLTGALSVAAAIISFVFAFWLSKKG